MLYKYSLFRKKTCTHSDHERGEWIRLLLVILHVTPPLNPPFQHASKPWCGTLNGPVVGARPSAMSSPFICCGGMKWRRGGMKGRADGKNIWEVWCNKDTGSLWGNIWDSHMRAKQILIYCPMWIFTALYIGQTVWHEHSRLTKQGLDVSLMQDVDAFCPWWEKELTVAS